MRIVVDHDICEANAICEQLAPELFELGEDDVLTILRPEPGPEQREAAREAVDRCPRLALSIVED